MRRSCRVAKRLIVAGLAASSLGVALVAVALVPSSGPAAFADSVPYELYCPGTPVGNIALNDVVTTGTISPSSPSVGQQFDLTNYQTSVSLPAAIVTAAAALGNSTISGSATTLVDATGATPANVSAGNISFNAPIPSPVPPSGLVLTLPSTAATVGPFTASGGTITLSVDPSVSLSLDVSGSTLSLTCNPYANNSEGTGIVTSTPSGSEISPVIALATPGSGGTTTTAVSGTTAPTTTAPTTTTTAPAASLTGAYELYCPNTPVGDIALNGAVTTASVSPASPSPGQSFDVTGYQTSVNLPNSLATAAAALGTNLEGSATAQVDVSGATPTSIAVGPLDFNVPIPSPVPADGVSLSLPSSPESVGPFTATSSAITVEEDSAASLTLEVSGSPLTLTCNAYPNNSVTTGIVTSAPTGAAITPVIAVVQGSTTSTTVAPTTTTMAPTTTTTTATTTTTSASSGTTTSAAPSSTTSGTGGSSTSTSSTPSTSAPATNSGSSTEVTARVVTASSGALAFTGTGPGLRLLLLLGVGFVVVGIGALVLADAPRRGLAWIGDLAQRHNAGRLGSEHSSRPAPRTSVARRLERLGSWLAGRDS